MSEDKLNSKCVRPICTKLKDKKQNSLIKDIKNLQIVISCSWMGKSKF